MLALRTTADLKIRGAVGVDIRRKKEFIGVVPDGDAVRKLHDGKPVVEDFEGGFLPFPFHDMAHYEHRLPFSFRPEIAQGMLRGGCAGELSA